MGYSLFHLNINFTSLKPNRPSSYSAVKAIKIQFPVLSWPHKTLKLNSLLYTVALKTQVSRHSYTDCITAGGGQKHQVFDLFPRYFLLHSKNTELSRCYEQKLSHMICGQSAAGTHMGGREQTKAITPQNVALR